MAPAATALYLCSSGIPTPTLNSPTKPIIISMCSTYYSPRYYYALSSGNRLRLTWFHTSSSSDHNHNPISAKKSAQDDSDSICDADTWLLDLEVKPPPDVPLTGNPDLLKIPGVGPKNLTKLVENEIAGVNDLKKIYKDKFFKSRKSNQKMVEFLQSSVGIKNRKHANSITTFIRNAVTKEIRDAAIAAAANSDPAQKKKG